MPPTRSRITRTAGLRAGLWTRPLLLSAARAVASRMSVDVASKTAAVDAVAVVAALAAAVAAVSAAAA